ncbi:MULTISPECIES: thioredoxin domain-containing protein [unclassified Novosphingobium]|nr:MULTISPECIES: thioredoxin domain-containing protein [unclassified Novosphingobium]
MRALSMLALALAGMMTWTTAGAAAGTGAGTAAGRLPATTRPPTTIVTRTATESHILGNPAAPVKLVEYISYTCPHCAEFHHESLAQLQIGFIGNGKGSVEIRSFVRDPVDMTVALLTHCGPPSKFVTLHNAFLGRQADWIGPMVSANAAQRQRWTAGDFASRTRAIASDFHFYEIMATHGFDRPATDRCLANKALADKLAKGTQDAVDKDFVTGTPSFVLNGVPLSGTYTWEALKPQIEARLH